MQGPFGTQRTIDVQRPHYRNEVNLPQYPRRPTHLEEPVMNANDGDPYSVGGQSRGSSHQSTIGGGSMHQNHNFMPPSSPQTNRNAEVAVSTFLS